MTGTSPLDFWLSCLFGLLSLSISHALVPQRDLNRWVSNNRDYILLDKNVEQLINASILDLHKLYKKEHSYHYIQHMNSTFAVQ
jgi:hypothetical protein